MYVLMFFGVMVAVAGFLMITPATLGVGLLAFACFLGILARIVQAAGVQRVAQDPPQMVAMPQVAVQLRR